MNVSNLLLSVFVAWAVALPGLPDVGANAVDIAENVTRDFSYEAGRMMQDKWQKFLAEGRRHTDQYTHTFRNGTNVTATREELLQILNPEDITTTIVNNTVTTLWPGKQTLEEHDPCNRGQYQMYKEYTDKDCKPPNNFAPNGMHCTVHNSSSTHCIDFCQVRTTYIYGKEMPVRGPNPNPVAKFPFEISWCHGKSPVLYCSLNSATKIEVQPLPAPDGGKFNQVYDHGISAGYDPVQHTLHATTGWQNKVLDQEECGYYTFLPIVKTVCGTRTEALESIEPGQSGTCLTSQVGDVHSAGNICVDEYVQRKSSDGKDLGLVDGKTVWVHVDCKTLEASSSDQDSDYARPGVALSKDELKNVFDEWRYLWCDLVGSATSWYYWSVGRLFADDGIGGGGETLRAKLMTGACNIGASLDWYYFQRDYQGPDGDRMDFQEQHNKHSFTGWSPQHDADKCFNPLWYDIGLKDEHACSQK